MAAWLAAVAVPASAWLQWSRWRRGTRGALAALATQAAVSAAGLGLLAATSAVLSRAPEPWHLSGDDAMGVGIDLLLLCGIAVACGAALATALGVAGRRRVSG